MSNLLYKYLDVKGAIMMLHYSNLMYANAMTFNDPLDCHPALIDFNNVAIMGDSAGGHLNLLVNAINNSAMLMSINAELEALSNAKIDYYA